MDYFEKNQQEDVWRKEKTKWRQVGNAVPVMMANILAMRIKEVYFDGKR